MHFSQLFILRWMLTCRFGDVGAALVSSKGVGKILFIGSPQTGQKVMSVRSFFDRFHFVSSISFFIPLFMSWPFFLLFFLFLSFFLFFSFLFFF
jgi:hypothetical protein